VRTITQKRHTIAGGLSLLYHSDSETGEIVGVQIIVQLGDRMTERRIYLDPDDLTSVARYWLTHQAHEAY
jgi:predicted RNA-binding protein with PUA-like domain